MFPAAAEPQPLNRRMGQFLTSQSSRPDRANAATSRAEGGALASERKEKEINATIDALIAAANRGELARVKEIIAGMKTNGLDINRQGYYGNTALTMACGKGHTEVALELLKIDGLDVNTQDSHGYTALMCACCNGLTEVAL
jgi:predicted transcriptional regulator